MALARRVLRICGKGSDRDVLKLLQFLEDCVDSKSVSEPIPTVFVRPRDAESNSSPQKNEPNRADRTDLVIDDHDEYVDVN